MCVVHALHTYIYTWVEKKKNQTRGDNLPIPVLPERIPACTWQDTERLLPSSFLSVLSEVVQQQKARDPSIFQFGAIICKVVLFHKFSTFAHWLKLRLLQLLLLCVQITGVGCASPVCCRECIYAFSTTSSKNHILQLDILQNGPPQKSTECRQTTMPWSNILCVKCGRQVQCHCKKKTCSKQIILTDNADFHPPSPWLTVSCIAFFTMFSTRWVFAAVLPEFSPLGGHPIHR